ncbi:unnamed protein product [Coffea canephora]|uniref:DH200=94 genomic scaffold, scaffold_5667 n=1 Tax=Coffea canephora TaxID=49390 RepID=A0A068VPQ6_COFCA|nr:unnamed protein product [Coffea canephora]
MYTCARICIKVHFSFYFLLKMVKIHVLIACLLMANYFMLHQAIIPPQNLTTDLSALLEFKSHISLDPFGFLDNWSSTTFVCNWTGISCAFKSQRVTALNLSNWSLRGIIPPHLGNLTFLTSLDFSHNNFSGFIPLQLANLISLKQMNVGYNNLSGEIPSWFGNLQEIRFLLLNNNAFSGAIPLSLGNISNLEKLNLGYNLLEGNIPKGIGNLSNLRTLTFRGNQLTGSIPSGIFNISLEEIDFAENSLSGTLPIDICNHQLKQIKGLNLSVNQFQGEIPSELYNCRDLEHVSLSYNQFNGRIPRTLGYLVKLKDLSLGGNIFTGVNSISTSNLCSYLGVMRKFANSVFVHLQSYLHFYSFLAIPKLHCNLCYVKILCDALLSIFSPR